MVSVALASVVGLLVGDAPTAPEAGAACAVSTNLGLGSRGGGVRCLQTTLNALGYNSGPVDGIFGGVTFRAVLAYQRAKGLFVDGLVGPQTGTALGIWGRSSSAPTTPAPAAPAPGAARCSISSSLRIGATGADVRCVQTALNAAGYSAGPVDGLFGNRTRRAVIGYQQATGLFVDGVAGRQTGTAEDLGRRGAGSRRHGVRWIDSQLLATGGRAGGCPAGGGGDIVG